LKLQIESHDKIRLKCCRRGTKCLEIQITRRAGVPTIRGVTEIRTDTIMMVSLPARRMVVHRALLIHPFPHRAG
jgi:hypothetical protein